MPEVIFNGPEGRLEGRYNHSKRPNAPIALFLHPHTHLGGTMNNKVIFTLCQNFVNRKFSTLRFYVRGVGPSPDRFDCRPVEPQDAAPLLARTSPPRSKITMPFSAPVAMSPSNFNTQSPSCRAMWSSSQRSTCSM